MRIKKTVTRERIKGHYFNVGRINGKFISKTRWGKNKQHDDVVKSFNAYNTFTKTFKDKFGNDVPLHEKRVLKNKIEVIDRREKPNFSNSIKSRWITSIRWGTGANQVIHASSKGFRGVRESELRREESEIRAIQRLGMAHNNGNKDFYSTEAGEEALIELGQVETRQRLQRFTAF